MSLIYLLVSYRATTRHVVVSSEHYPSLAAKKVELEQAARHLASELKPIYRIEVESKINTGWLLDA
jgi:hypothetical protein